MNTFIIPPHIIFSDFDGTIVDEQSYRIDPLIGPLLDQLSSEVAIVLVTSRGWDGIKPFSSALSLQLPQILGNGAFLLDPISEQTLVKKTLSAQSIKTIYEVIKKYSLQIGFSVADTSFSDSEKMLTTDDIGRISLLVPEEFMENVLKELEQISEVLLTKGDAMRSENGLFLIDITPVGIDKLYGVKQWLSLYGKEVKKVSIVGNGDNDLPLFTSVLKGKEVEKIAVADALFELKNKADKIIPPPSKNGFYYYLSSLKR